jgi:hypothetical protein
LQPRLVDTQELNVDSDSLSDVTDGQVTDHTKAPGVLHAQPLLPLRNVIVNARRLLPTPRSHHVPLEHADDNKPAYVTATAPRLTIVECRAADQTADPRLGASYRRKPHRNGHLAGESEIFGHESTPTPEMVIVSRRWTSHDRGHV